MGGNREKCTDLSTLEIKLSLGGSLDIGEEEKKYHRWHSVFQLA